ncbi:MAG: hypothetical protein PHX83_01775 [Acidobacteriia bacterium]|nr:hypothetical protein [Terriglobia bacterium]
MSQRSWCLGTLAVLGVMIYMGSIAFAQPRGGMMGGGPMLSGLLHPKVGYGAVYESVNGQGETSRMSMAVVGKEEVQGTTGYWMEISFADPRSGGDMVMKYLLAPQGTSVHFYRVIMKNAALGVVEMPEMMTDRINQTVGQGLSTTLAGMGKNLGTEVITTKAGPKKCTHWQRENNGVTSDVWINEDVYPTSLVKSVTKTANGTHTMTLIEELSNATTKIIEQPKPFAMPGMRPPGN